MHINSNMQVGNENLDNYGKLEDNTAGTLSVTFNVAPLNTLPLPSTVIMYYVLLGMSHLSWINFYKRKRDDQRRDLGRILRPILHRNDIPQGAYLDQRESISVT